MPTPRMPVGPSRPSSNESSFGKGKSNDARRAGFAPEDEVDSFEGTTRNAYVSEYPYQVNTEAFLSLTAYFENNAEATMSAFVADGNAQLIQYGPNKEDFSYVPDPANDNYVQISEDGGVTWGRYPIVTPSSSTSTNAIRFQRSAERPDVDSTAMDAGTGWNDQPPSLPTPEPRRRDPLWATVAVLDTSNSNVIEEWSVAFPIRGVHNAHEVATQYSDGSGTWKPQYDSSIHTEVRFSSDQGANWTSAFTLSNGNVKFQRSGHPPNYDQNASDPGADWVNTPPSGSLPLWVIWDDPNSSDPNWRAPVQAVPPEKPWKQGIVTKKQSSGDKKKDYETQGDFRALPLSKEELVIYWKLESGILDSAIIGSHTFDRDQKPEFDGQLMVRGQDLVINLRGDEDVESYKVAANIGGTSFPDDEAGDYYEGRTFRSGGAINLGVIEKGQVALVTVTPYSDKEATEGGGEPQDPGKEQTFSVQRESEGYLLQGRYGNSPEGPLTQGPSGGDSYFQMSPNGGIRWTRSLSTSGFTENEFDENVYFQRSLGAPEVDLYSATPGTGWQDTPPSGSITLWMIRGPVDSNGDLLSWARWTTPVIILDEVSANTLPPDQAVAQFSDQSDGPWSDTYSSGDEYVRVSWDEGANWEVAKMDTPDSNPTRPDGSTITENVVNRFQRSQSEPSVDNGSYSSPGTGWDDFPTTNSGNLWMISGLADLDKDELIDPWSDPIRLIEPSETGGLIEFSTTANGPWGPIYESEDGYFHISRDNAATWEVSRPLSETYFKQQQSEPSSTTDPSADGWTSTPPEGNPDTETPLWVVLTDGSGGWTDPERVKQDISPRGPQDSEVYVQYSNDKVSWHDEIRSSDKWMRQRIGDGYWTAPIRIKGEGGDEGRFRNFLFKASRFPNDAPPIDETIPDWDSGTSYSSGDRVFYDGDGTYKYWEATTSNSGVTPSTSVSEWDNVNEKTFDADSNWVDGPYEALQNGSDSEIYVWAINALFEADASSSTDTRLENWDGPLRFNGVDSEDFYIKPENGRSIKNSDPNKTLPLKVVEIQGGEQTELTDSDNGPELYWKDPNVDYSSVTRDFDLVDTISGISSTRQPTFGEPQIDGSLTLFLRDGNQDSDTSYDTINLFDSTDGLSGGYVESPEGLVVTHYAAREIDTVTPSPLSFIGKFTDTQDTEHLKDVEFTGYEDANGDLAIDISIGSVNNDAAIDEVRVIEGGVLQVSVSSGGTDSSTTITNPDEVVVEFDGKDPQTDEVITLSEQLQTSIDNGSYKIRSLDGDVLSATDDGKVEYEVWRSDGDGTRQVDLSNTEFKLVLRPDTDAIVKTGSPVVIGSSDLSDPPNVLQLQDGTGGALDAVTIKEANSLVPEISYSLDQITENGVEKGKLTFEIVDDPNGVADTLKTRKAVARNLKDDATDPFGSDLISGSETSPYTEKVELKAKHNSFIEVKMTFTTPRDPVRKVFTFDQDQNPEITNARVFTDEDDVLSIGHIFDADADEVKIEWRKNSEQASDYEVSENSPVGQVDDHEIIEAGSLIPVRLTDRSDFADVRLTPQTTGGQTGPPVVLRVHANNKGQKKPDVKDVTLTQVSGTPEQGKIQFTVSDPDNVVLSQANGGVEARRAIGENIDGQTYDTVSNHSWFSNPSGDTYEALVDLDRNRNSFIEIRLQTDFESYNFVYSFDRDQDPEADYSSYAEPRTAVNPDGNDEKEYVYRFSAEGDEDVAGYKVIFDHGNGTYTETRHFEGRVHSGKKIHPTLDEISAGEWHLGTEELLNVASSVEDYTANVEIQAFSEWDSNNGVVAGNAASKKFSQDVPISLGQRDPKLDYEVDQYDDGAGTRYGQIDFSVVDTRDSIVDSVETRKAVARNLNSNDSFQAGPGSSPLSYDYRERVELKPKHNSFIEVRVTFVEDRDPITRTFAFDHDIDPDAEYTVDKGYAQVISGVAIGFRTFTDKEIRYRVEASGDEDVAGYKVIFTHAEGTSNEKEFISHVQGRTIASGDKFIPHDIESDGTGWYLDAATLREALADDEPLDAYEARIQVIAYSDWDSNNNVVQGRADTNAFDQQVGIQSGAINPFDPKLNNANISPVTRSGGSFLMYGDVNEDADGYAINWKVFDKDDNLIDEWDNYDSTSGLDVHGPGEERFYIEPPPKESASNGPGYGWIEMIPAGSPTAYSGWITGDKKRWEIGPPADPGTRFTIVGAPSSSTSVDSDSSKDGELVVTSESAAEGQKYNVNAPQNIGPNAEPEFNGVTLPDDNSGTKKVNEVSDDTDLADAKSDAVVTENAAKAYADDKNTQIASAVVQTQAEIDALDEVTVRKSRKVEITGTQNQVSISGRSGVLRKDVSVTLSAPQNLHTSADFEVNSLTAAATVEAGTHVSVNSTNTPSDGQIALGAQADESFEAVRAGRTVEILAKANRILVDSNNTTQGDLTDKVSVQLDAPQNLHTDANFEVDTLSVDTTAVPSDGQIALASQADEQNEAVRADRTVNVSGTTNRVTVNNSAQDLTGDPSFTVDAPQDLHTGADFRVSKLRVGTSQSPANAGGANFTSIVKHPSFTDGWTGTNWRVKGTGEMVGESLFLRGPLTVSELIVNRIHAVDGTQIIGAGRGRIETVSGSAPTETLSLEDPNGNGVTSFTAGDLVIVQEVDVDNSTIVKRIVREVDSVDNTIAEITLRDHSDGPTDSGSLAEGDTIVVFGHISNTDRQNVLVATATNSDAPYRRTISGVDSWSAWQNSDKVKTQTGNIDALSPDNPGFGFYGGSVRLEDDVIVGNLDAATSGTSGEYLKYNGSSLEIVLSGGDVETRISDNTGRSVVLRQTSEPTDSDVNGRTLEAGDIWVDTDAEDGIYTYDGSSWVQSQTQSVVIRQASEPTQRPDGTALQNGDVWIETDNENSVYTWDSGSSSWVRTQTQNVVIRQSNEPTQRSDGSSLQGGDVWVDTDNGEQWVYDDSNDTFVRTEAALRSQADQNSADIELIAQRMTQEQEARSALEITASETEAKAQLNAEIIGPDFDSSSTITAFANETESNFTASVQYTDDGTDADGNAVMKLRAGVGGSSSAVVGADNIILAGETTVLDTFTVKDTNIDPDYTISGTEAVVIRQSGEPTQRPNGSVLQDGDIWIDTDAENTVYGYNASGSTWERFQSENVVIRQSSEPTQRTSGNSLQEGDVWIDTDDGDTVYSYDGTNFQNTQSGNVTMRQTGEPTQRPSGASLQEGDIWIDTDAGNRVYSYDGSSFVAVRSENAVIRQTSEPTQRPDGSTLETGDVWIDTDANDTVYTYDGSNFTETQTGNVTMRQNSEPSNRPNGNSLQAGDIWIDTDADDTVYTYDGTSFTQTASDSVVIRQSGEPTQRPSGNALQEGDVWIDTDANDAVYTYDGSSFTATQTGNITIRQASEPGSRPNGNNLIEGDTWVDTDDGNTTYTYDGTDFVKTEANLRTRVTDNEADIQLVAERLTQESESRAGLEITASENQSKLEASVQFTDVGNPSEDPNRAALELRAGPEGSDATIVGDSIELDGNTLVTGQFTVKDTNIAENYRVTIRSDTEPTSRPNGSSLKDGDIWIETDTDDTVYSYDSANSNWVPVQSESVVIRQTSEPSNRPNGNALQEGDVWIDTDADDTVYTYNGSSFTETQSGNVTIRQNTEPSNRPNGNSLQQGDIWIDTDADDTVYTYDGSSFTQTSTDSVVIRSSSEPSNRPNGNSLEQGDVWIDTDDGNKVYTYDGSSFNATVDDTVTIRQSSAPSSRPDGSALQEGDVWIDTDNGDKPYSYNAGRTSWDASYTSIDGGNIVTSSITTTELDASNINVSAFNDDGTYTNVGNEFQTIRKSSTPSDSDVSGRGLQAGDVWIDTDDGDKPYTYNGSGFTQAYTAISGGNLDTGSVTADKLEAGTITSRAGAKAWHEAYATDDMDSDNAYERTIQIVVRPNEGKIHVGIMQGAPASGESGTYDISFTATNPETMNPSFSSGSTSSSVFGGSGDNVGSGGGNTLNVNGSYGGESDCYELTLDSNFGENSEVKIEINDWTVHSSQAITGGATILETGDTIDASSFSSTNPYVFYAHGTRTKISGGNILTESLGAESISINSGGSVQSGNFESGVSGWRINYDGAAEFQSGTFRGDIDAQSGTLQDLNLEGTIDFLGTDGKLKLGSGSDAFFVSDFSLSGSGSDYDNKTVDPTEACAADGDAGCAPPGGSQTYTDSATYDPATDSSYTDSDFQGSEVEVSHSWVSTQTNDGPLTTIDPDTYVEATLEVKEHNGSGYTSTYSKTAGSIGRSGDLTITFTANSDTDYIEVYLTVTASYGEDEDYYTKVTMDNDGNSATIEWTNDQDFIGSSGAKWKESGNEVLKLDATAMSHGTNPNYNYTSTESRIKTRGGMIVIQDDSGTDLIKIHPQGYIDFKQIVSNGGDIPEPPSGWVRICAESNNTKMARKAGDGSANDF